MCDRLCTPFQPRYIDRKIVFRFLDTYSLTFVVSSSVPAPVTPPKQASEQTQPTLDGLLLSPDFFIASPPPRSTRALPRALSRSEFRETLQTLLQVRPNLTTIFPHYVQLISSFTLERCFLDSIVRPISTSSPSTMTQSDFLQQKTIPSQFLQLVEGVSNVNQLDSRSTP